MSKLKKIGLFLSSFSPLFILIIIKEIIEIINKNWTLNLLNSSLMVIVLLFLFIGLFSFFSVYKEVNLAKCKKIKVIKKTNITDQHFLGYFSIFVLFAITFEIEMYSMAVIFFVVLFLIGRVYIKNDMYYINPLINLMGFSFYDIQYQTSNGLTKNARVFYKGSLDEDATYLMQDSYCSFMFLKCKKNL